MEIRSKSNRGVTTVSLSYGDADIIAQALALYGHDRAVEGLTWSAHRAKRLAAYFENLDRLPSLELRTKTYNAIAKSEVAK